MTPSLSESHPLTAQHANAYRLGLLCLAIAACAGLAALTVWHGRVILNLPTVYESWSKQECVRVDDPTGRYDCRHVDNVLTRYDHVWVK